MLGSGSRDESPDVRVGLFLCFDSAAACEEVVMECAVVLFVVGGVV